MFVPRAGLEPARPYGQEIFLPHYVTIANIFVTTVLMSGFDTACDLVMLLWSGLSFYLVEILAR